MSKTPPHRGLWMRSGTLFGFAELATQLGHDPQAMLRRFGLPAALLSDPEMRISYPAACRLLEACATEWQCPDFGLRLAQAHNLNVLGPIGLVARLSRTVADALKTLHDHLNCHSSGFEMRLHLGGVATQPDALAAYVPRPGAQAGAQKHELAMAQVRNVIAMVSGIPGFTPLRVDFACGPPSGGGRAQRFFGCPVRYQQAQTALVFDRDVLERPTAIYDPAIEPLVHRYLEQLHQQTHDDVVAATRSMIGMLLASGHCTRDEVARCLNLHPRTLQRRLDERATSFSALLDNHRRELALELVGRGRSLSMGQIADMPGYADPSAFHQAFRRWTDSTPRGFRA